MAGKKFVKGSEEWMMFQDYWNFCQSVWNIEKSDDYWQQVIDNGESFAQKYGLFGKELALALVHELERKSREEEE